MAASEELRDEVMRILEDQKASDLQCYDVRARLPLTDWFVVATGEAGRHLEAMAETLRMKFKPLAARGREGTGESGWLLFDLGDVIVHLFSADRRRYYALDDLCGGAAAARQSAPKA